MWYVYIGCIIDKVFHSEAYSVDAGCWYITTDQGFDEYRLLWFLLVLVCLALPWPPCYVKIFSLFLLCLHLPFMLIYYVHVSISVYHILYICEFLQSDLDMASFVAFVISIYSKSTTFSQSLLYSSLFWYIHDTRQI